jgi:circadian clock protein KaiC
MYVLKSRGMAHSNQLREFVMTSRGIKLIPPYIGSGGVLTGSSRVNQEAKEQAEAAERTQNIALKSMEVQQRRLALQAQVASLQSELAALEQQTQSILKSNEHREKQIQLDQASLARSRQAIDGTGDRQLT